MTARPDDVTVWIGLDVGKKEHFADVLDNAGERLFARPCSTARPISPRSSTAPRSTVSLRW